MAVPDLWQLKNLFVAGLDYANERAPFFVPANRALSDFQKLAAREARNLNEFMTAVTLKNSAWQNAFDPPVKLYDYEQATHFKFGEGDKEWYFVIGIFQGMAFVFCLFRLEVAPPAVVRTMFDDPSQAVVWNLWGGFGYRGSERWTQFPFEWLQGPYESRPGSSFRMSLSNATSDFKVDFAMTENHVFDFTVAFGATKLSATVRALGPPLPNADNGCLFCGKYGLQSKYFSRSNCDARATLNGRQYSDGHGWIDHQSFYLAQGHSFFGNLMGNSLRVVANIQVAWLWMYVQDLRTSTQYMLMAGVKPKQFESGKKYKVMCNMYDTKTVQLGVKGAEVTVGRTVRDQDFNYPLEYKIRLPSKETVVLKASYGVGAFPNASRIDSWEVPAVLYNDMNQEIGFGIVELNGTTPQKTQVRRLIQNLAPRAVEALAVQ
jgi:hypothetical protein